MYVPRGTLCFPYKNVPKGFYPMSYDIKEKFELADISLIDSQLEKMEKMIGFLTEYNQKVNLTAITDREGIIEKHLLDSALPLKLYSLKENADCLDIGTGAGFPAIPMMICRPDLKFVLLDARRKRIDYLKLLLPELGVCAKEIIHGRAEELGRSVNYKGRFDMITARAVSDIPTLLRYAAPMLKKGGVFMAMRGAKDELDGEVKRISEKLSLSLEREIMYKLPGGDGRRLILFVKVN